jgi:hypothetical protein
MNLVRASNQRLAVRATEARCARGILCAQSARMRSDCGRSSFSLEGSVNDLWLRTAGAGRQ